MVQKSKKLKNIKKQFFEVSAPLVSSKIHLYGSTAEEMDGKVVSMDLTRNLRGKGLLLNFRVKYSDEKLMGELLSLQLAGVYVRRMMRKGTDYVEDSFITNCKDSRLIVKPFLITRNKVSRAVRRELREKCKESLIEYFKGRDTKELFSEVMTNKLQKGLVLRLKKIYPLALCEIRWLEIISEQKVKEMNQAALEASKAREVRESMAHLMDQERTLSAKKKEEVDKGKEERKELKNKKQ